MGERLIVSKLYLPVNYKSTCEPSSGKHAEGAGHCRDTPQTNRAPRPNWALRARRVPNKQITRHSKLLYLFIVSLLLQQLLAIVASSAPRPGPNNDALLSDARLDIYKITGARYYLLLDGGRSPCPSAVPACRTDFKVN